MRRTTDEAKAALALRLDEYNAKQRARRKMYSACITVLLCVTVTAAAVPVLIANSRNNESVYDAADDILVQEQSALKYEEATIDGLLAGTLNGNIHGADAEGAPETVLPIDGTMNGSEKFSEGEQAGASVERGEITMTLTRGGEITTLSEEVTVLIVGILRESVKKDDAWGVYDVTAKLVIESGAKSYSVSVTDSGDVMIGGEYYSVNDGEALLSLLGCE